VHKSASAPVLALSENAKRDETWQPARSKKASTTERKHVFSPLDKSSDEQPDESAGGMFASYVN